VKTATIFNIQRFSLHDGPGIRTTVFVKGCPLRCAWCHNPESMAPGPEPLLTASHCVGCELCLPVCAEDLTGRIDRPDAWAHPGQACTRCGECADVCPTGARKLVGQDWSVPDLLDELARDAVYHAASTGGVTFSGGEPLTAHNAPFVLACLKTLAARGIHTAVDTCGHVPPDRLSAAAQLSDLVLYDLKIMDPARHAQATGRDNDLILSNLAGLLAAGHHVWVRVPLIPGQNTDRDNLVGLATFLKDQRQVPFVQLLPYHATGREKYARLGRTYELPDTPGQTTAEVDACADLFREHGLQVQVGG